MIDRDSIPNGRASLSLILNEKGGVIDDTVITNLGDHIYMVVNGACKEGDLQHFNNVLNDKFKGKDVSIEYNEDRSLVAL